MTRQLEEHYAWLEEQAERELKEAREAVEEARSRTRQLEEFYVHAYEEAQSRLRLSCTCKEMTRPLTYPLTSRILELASAFGLADYRRAISGTAEDAI